MGIAEQKKEILDLLERIHSGSDRTPQLARGEKKKTGQAAASTPLSDRILRRRQELVELRNRRDRIGADLLEERLLSICQMLEKRISRIEALISQGAPTGGGRPAARPVAVPEPPAEEPRAEEPGGLEVVENNLDAMMPDLGIMAAESQAGAEAAPAADSGSHDLAGAVEGGVLPDILQMVSSNAKTGIFTLVGEGKHIELYLRDGELYHALAEGLVGQSAFFAAMALEEGRFYFQESEQIPDEKTIDGNTQFMILEALRQIDEQQGGE